MGYPNYMKRQRRPDVTPAEMDAADKIRQKIVALACKRGYGVRYYTDQIGRHMASIGRIDGRGMGFTLTAKQAAAWMSEQTTPIIRCQ